MKSGLLVQLFEIRWAWNEGLQWRVDWRELAEMHFMAVANYGPSDVVN